MKNWFYSINNLLTLSIGFVIATIPLSIGLNSISVIIFALVFIIGIPNKEKIATFKLNYKLILLSTSIYILYILGVLYSSNQAVAFKQLEIKASLLLFPLLFGSIPANRIDLKKLFLIFIFAIFITSLYASIVAYLAIVKNPELKFDENTIANVLDIHRVYYSNYILLSIIFCINNLSISKLVSKITIINSLAILYFTFILFLMSARNSIACLLIIVFIVIIKIIITEKKYVLGLILGLLTLGSTFIAYQKVPRLNQLVKEMLDSKDTTKITSATMRWVAWEKGIEVINENLLVGTGTGDSQDELMKKYKISKLDRWYDENLSIHNEYLDIFMTLGIIGLLVFIATLVVPFFIALKTSDYIFSLFLLIFSIACITDTPFESNKFIVFYAFWNSILLFQNKKSIQLTN